MLWRACLLVLALTARGAIAQEACRHALVMAVDISGSVNADEYQLQIDGLSDALLSREVGAILLETPETPVALAIFEWSSEDHQRLIQDWIFIRTQADIDAVAHRLTQHQKDRVTLKTAIGGAIEFAGVLLSEQPQCWRKTIDISGDGENNDGPRPDTVRNRPAFRDVIINALVISEGGFADPRIVQQDSTIVGVDTRKPRDLLMEYYLTHVIHGPEAFAEVARGYQDYAEAMRRKLLRELSPFALVGYLDADR